MLASSLVLKTCKLPLQRARLQRLQLCRRRRRRRHRRRSFQPAAPARARPQLPIKQLLTSKKRRDSEDKMREDGLPVTDAELITTCGKHQLPGTGAAAPLRPVCLLLWNDPSAASLPTTAEMP